MTAPLGSCYIGRSLKPTDVIFQRWTAISASFLLEQCVLLMFSLKAEVCNAVQLLVLFPVAWQIWILNVD